MGPIVRIEIDSMKCTLLQAFSDRMFNLSTEVALALDRACTQESLQAILDETTKAVVKEAVQSAIRHWWAVSAAGRNLIASAVAERLDEEAAIYAAKAKD